MHEPIVLAGAWLKRVVERYFRYHAVPGNLAVLGRFRERICATGGLFSVGAASGGNAPNSCAVIGSADLRPETGALGAKGSRRRSSILGSRTAVAGTGKATFKWYA